MEDSGNAVIIFEELETILAEVESIEQSPNTYTAPDSLPADAYSWTFSLKDSTFQKPTWPLSRVEKTFPGPDNLVHVVDVYYTGKKYRRPVHKLVLLVPAN